MTPYEQAAASLRQELQAERVVVLERENGEWRSRAALGISITRLQEASISLSLIEEVARSGLARIEADVQETSLNQRLSVMMGGLQSCACLPWWNPGGQLAGVLYADCTRRSNFFSPKNVTAAQRLARRLEEEIFGSVTGQSQEQVPRTFRQPEKKLEAEVAQPRKAPERALWLRSLAVMLEAGLPLLRALHVLMKTSAQPQILEHLCRQVEEGAALHRAFAASGAFSKSQVQLVKAGELSGALVVVLRRLADHEDQLQEHRQRLAAALVYPAVVGLLALIMLSWLIPSVLGGQLEILQRSGQALPLLTRLLMLAPYLVWLLLPVAWLLKKVPQRLWFRAPALGGLLRSSSTWKFCETLALIYEAGLPLPEALSQAGQAAQNPDLHPDRVINLVLGGATLAEALRLEGGLPPLVVETIRVGEETGTVPAMLRHAGKMARLDFDSALDGWSKMLEPILLGGAGLLVALVLVGTLLPTMGMLDQL
ncbi:MAG: type II secretion system F family protein [Candidatus Eremiobacteraeota bacterium]|nr:type II secretion system F family protein [Candidatus Eremiobacteraeota bacterium]MCW5871502.1 type II secretion system F family protein [Candidatus Eremiobacteraeota bacterium]